jgi:hypothetical protein
MYGFSVSFELTRRQDHDEEHEQKGFEVVVSARDNAGNLGSSPAFVLVRQEHGDQDSKARPNDY